MNLFLNVIFLASFLLVQAEDPLSRFGHSAVYLPDGQLLVYGGYAFERTELSFENQYFVGLKGDLWTFANGTWTEIIVDEQNSDGIPPARMLHSAVLRLVPQEDTINNVSVLTPHLVIHGGLHYARYNGDWSTVYRGCGHDDMWSFDVTKKTWSLIQEDPADLCSSTMRVGVPTLTIVMLGMLTILQFVL